MLAERITGDDDETSMEEVGGGGTGTDSVRGKATSNNVAPVIVVAGT